MPEQARPAVDQLFAEILKAGESIPALREVLRRQAPDDLLLLDVLRRAVPLRLLEFLAATAPWSENARLLAGIVLNPRLPRPLGLRLVANLYWRDQAEIAARLQVSAPIRLRAEDLLKQRLPDLRLGERIALAKIATPPVLGPLLTDPDPRVAEACLVNPRLREPELLLALKSDTVPRALVEAVASSAHWRERYAIRLTLARQPRTPVAIALGQLRHLVLRDLRSLAEDKGVLPLVGVAAQRLAEGHRH
jgi:hypothetical protein